MNPVLKIIGWLILGSFLTLSLATFLGVTWDGKADLPKPITVATIPFQVKEGDYNTNFNFKGKKQTYKIVNKTQDPSIVSYLIHSSLHDEKVKLTGYVGTRGFEFYFFVIAAEMESGKKIFDE